METQNRTDTPAVKESGALRWALQAISARARARHPLLAHQDAIGFTIVVFSVAAILASGSAYYAQRIPAWLAVLLPAFFMSILHEVEHDLIHRLYFKESPRLYNLMMLVVWLFRPSTVSPWVRRDWHLHHHRVSGTPTDLEERGITNGESWGLRRLLMTLDGVLAIVLRPRTTREMLLGYAAAQKPADKRAYKRILWRNRLSYVPLGVLYFALWHTFLAVHACELLALWLGLQISLPAWLLASMSTIDFLAVVLLLPNVLRTFCLHFVSSNIHYYGDIEPRNVVQQTQVWTSLWTLPLQLFCFNFGGTHAIHHFVVQEPFYLRQLIARAAYPHMRAHGVRFNDFSAMSRGNRWRRSDAGAQERVTSVAPT